MAATTTLKYTGYLAVIVGLVVFACEVGYRVYRDQMARAEAERKEGLPRLQQLEAELLKTQELNKKIAEDNENLKGVIDKLEGAADTTVPVKQGFSEPSKESKEATVFTLTNSTPGSIDLYWVDFQGQEKHYARLKPTHQWQQPTYVGHKWIVRGKDGAALQKITASELGEHFTIRSKDVVRSLPTAAADAIPPKAPDPFDFQYPVRAGAVAGFHFELIRCRQDAGLLTCYLRVYTKEERRGYAPHHGVFASVRLIDENGEEHVAKTVRVANHTDQSPGGSIRYVPGVFYRVTITFPTLRHSVSKLAILSLPVSAPDLSLPLPVLEFRNVDVER